VKSETVFIYILAAQSFVYLALCFFVVARTGSTEGLADIGNAAAMTVSANALAAVGSRRE